MRILLTNDDGIRAPGLRALADALYAAGHRLWVCAPHVERSAAGHSAVIGVPLHANAVDYPLAERAWESDGTPADCARLGLYLTRDMKIDMVLSGINFGMNMGGACVYSGTVGAAMEAAMCGTQALAVSLCVDNRATSADFAPAARLAVRVADWAIEHPLPRGCIYSLNVPDCAYEAIRGLVPAPLAPVFLCDADYRCEADGYRYVYNEPLPIPPDSDVGRVRAGYATLTRLTWDFRMPGDDPAMAEIEL